MKVAEVRDFRTQNRYVKHVHTRDDATGRKLSEELIAYLVRKFWRLVLRFLHAARDATIAKECAFFARRAAGVPETPWSHNRIHELGELLSNICRR